MKIDDFAECLTDGVAVLEPNHETIKDAHPSFITQVSDIVFETLEYGVEYLKSFRI